RVVRETPEPNQRSVEHLASADRQRWINRSRLQRISEISVVESRQRYRPLNRRLHLGHDGQHPLSRHWPCAARSTVDATRQASIPNSTRETGTLRARATI